MAGSTAGGSAAEKARELRAKAARLEEQARQWEKGAEGERRTAAVLSSLAQHGYVVLDDLSVPGSKANIDHVVIGPTGVTVIETKAYSGRLDLRDGVLWHGRYPLRRELAAARFEADKVRAVVATTGWPVMVRSLMCIHSDAVPSDPDGRLSPIQLCGSLDLLATIKAAPDLLAPEHVSHLAQVIEEALPPRGIAAPPPVPPAKQRLGLVVPLPTRPRSFPLVRTVRRVVGAMALAARRVTALLIAIVMVVLGLAIIAAIASSALEGLAPDASTTTTTATTIVAPPPPPG